MRIAQLTLAALLIYVTDVFEFNVLDAREIPCQLTSASSRAYKSQDDFIIRRLGLRQLGQSRTSNR